MEMAEVTQTKLLTDRTCELNCAQDWNSVFIWRAWNPKRKTTLIIAIANSLSKKNRRRPILKSTEKIILLQKRVSFM